MVLKTTGLISRFQCTNRFWKICPGSRDIYQNVPKFRSPNQTCIFSDVLVNISWPRAYFSKLICALKLKLAIVCLTGGRWLWLKRRLTIAVLWCCKTLDKGARRQSILLWWGLPGSIWLCMAPPPLLITSWRHLLIWNYWHKGVLWCSVYWLSMQAYSRLPCRTGESRN